jgi:AcrR family transcriptional regulator
MKDTKVKKRKGVRPGRRTANRNRPGPDELARIALDLFAERHFASVTIKDIGRAANVNSAMIYYYYQDKEHLFRAAIESAIDEAFDLFAKHCSSEVHEDPAETILAWFDTHVALYKQLRNVVKISVDCKGVVAGPGVMELTAFIGTRTRSFKISSARASTPAVPQSRPIVATAT